MSPSHKSLSSALLLLCLACVPSAFASEPGDTRPPLAEDDANAIRVLLASDLETTLSSQMNGTLGELKASLGQHVDKNATLAQLQCVEVQARAKVAGAELNMARQNLAAKRNLRKLDAAGDLEVAMANTEVSKAEGALTLAKAQAGYCQVQAPFGGRVVKVYVKPYQTVQAGAPLFDLVSDSALKVRLNVPSTLLPQLKADMPLEVQIHETGKRYPAKVSAINARVDAVAQTVELEARLDAAYPELIAGMSGIARFPAAHE
ncbi:efflux RND transporter periplasmic adaptor subunit [Pseudomonas sp. S 311-6]|uniref:efflux RND transporter periplasmic adaptor subunit n=1 Tax=Pseudomonas TaxID=286 RepID=UPI002096F082|nr:MULTISPECIES: efflux RND transporter periplasmic adaptor subunit [Pseudomonas]MCO7565081.1 efflux RND transporter periplasmic adaptor subunit [Pseudomonas mosselii]MCO7616320.1 efflux RND transporter periplasmic adaptor subunit [Pseudomonas guariconensis]MCO7639377.1 efflux RND transporter periplasmic adaptor subunit [Pseudomonas sp. S 311-6]